MTAQIVLLCFIMLEIGYQAAMNGKPHKHDHCFWTNFLSWLIFLTVLYWGGFWDTLLS